MAGPWPRRRRRSPASASGARSRTVPRRRCRRRCPSARPAAAALDVAAAGAGQVLGRRTTPTHHDGRGGHEHARPRGAGAGRRGETTTGSARRGAGGARRSSAGPRGEVGEDVVHPGGHVGGHRLGVAGVGEEAAYAPRRRGRAGEVVGLVGHGAPPSRAAGRWWLRGRGDRTGADRRGVPGDLAHAGRRVPRRVVRHGRPAGRASSAASRARPREQRDFTVPSAQSSITATSATG